MTLPYTARIMALIGNEAMELARFTSQMFPHTVRCVTADLKTYWWIERPLPDHKCISSRWESPVSQAAKNRRAKRARMK